MRYVVLGCGSVPNPRLSDEAALVSQMPSCQNKLMVAPGFLKNPIVREWLDGVLPAWTWLDFESFVALRDERAALGGAIRLPENPTGAKFDGVMVRNTTILLRHAMEDGGNCSPGWRAVV